MAVTWKKLAYAEDLHMQNTDIRTTSTAFTISSNTVDAGELYLGQDNAGVDGDDSVGIRNANGTLQYKNKTGNWTDIGGGDAKAGLTSSLGLFTNISTLPALTITTGVSHEIT